MVAPITHNFAKTRHVVLQVSKFVMYIGEVRFHAVADLKEDLVSGVPARMSAGRRLVTDDGDDDDDDDDDYDDRATMTRVIDMKILSHCWTQMDL